MNWAWDMDLPSQEDAWGVVEIMECMVLDVKGWALGLVLHESCSFLNLNAGGTKAP